MTRRVKIALLAGAAVLALGGIGGGVAFAASSTPSTPGATPAAPTSTAPAPGPARRHHRHPRARNLLGRAEHGQFTVRTKQGTEVVEVQRGAVTAVGPTSVTVRSQDGFSARYPVGSAAKVRAHGQASTITSVHVGDQVRVLAVAGSVRRLADSGS